MVTDLHDYDGGAMSTCQEATLGVFAGHVDRLVGVLTGVRARKMFAAPISEPGGDVGRGTCSIEEGIVSTKYEYV